MILELNLEFLVSFVAKYKCNENELWVIFITLFNFRYLLETYNYVYQIFNFIFVSRLNKAVQNVKIMSNSENIKCKNAFK